MLPILIAIVVCAVGFADVEYVAGDPARLVARVASAKPADEHDYASLLEIEVENRAAVPAEPLVFEFFEPGAKGAPPSVVGRWTRAEAPHYGRSGRVIAPASKLVVPAVVSKSPTAAKKIGVRVVRASFAQGAVAIASPLSFVSRRTAREHDPDERRDVDVSFVRVKNTLDRPVDAVFLLRYGKKGAGLARGRVAAATTSEVRIRCALHSDEGTFDAGEPTDIDLVDWSVDEQRESSAQPLVDVIGSLRAIGDGKTATARARIDATGGQTFCANGAVQVGEAVTFTPPSTLSVEESQLAVKSVQQALRFVRRDPLRMKTVADATLVALDDVEVYRVPDFSLSGMKGGHVALKAGKVAWWAFDAAPGRLFDELATTMLGDGIVIVSLTAHAAYQDVPTEEERWTYADRGALPVPSAYSSAERSPALNTETFVRVTFEDWRVVDAALQDGSAANAVPTGAAADALRAAWTLPFTVPAGSPTIAGSYALENAGNDALWKGQRKVSGTFRLVGVRRDGWESWTVTVDKPKLTKEAQAAIAEVVEDRLRMFVWRDPAHRPSFDDAFRGARVDADAKGFAITEGSMARVDVADGKPTRIEFADGRTRTIDWIECDGRWVARKVTTGVETIAWTWTKAAPDVLWPATVEMRNVFEDWGPETIAFSKVKLE